MTRRRTIGLAALAVVAVVAAIAISRGGLPWRRTAPTARGDAARGAKLYETLPCGSCHDISRPWPGGDICPNLGNIAAEAARIVRQPDYHGRATDAAGYIRESIVDPNAYIVPGPTYRQADGQSVMPKTFGQTLSPTDLDDLVAFLLSRR
jgi:nitric oxide reductase subunit C